MRQTHRQNGSAEKHNLTLTKLQRSCSRALDRYVKAAEQTRAFMAQAERSPLYEDAQVTLLEHLRAETRAHDAYMRARRQLWTVLVYKGERHTDVFPIAA
jgi:hypothetical protein